MSRGTRPGGLTALAVLNFIIGAFWGFATLIMGLTGALVIGAADSAPDEAGAARATWVVLIILILLATRATLLFTAGVGYLGQKRIIGRHLGNAYAVVAVLGTTVNLATGGDFQISTMITLIYPAMTLLLVNTTFKDDLVN